MPVKPSYDPSKVRVYGPGVGDVSASLPVSFCIDTSEAGIAELEVSIQVSVFIIIELLTFYFLKKKKKKIVEYLCISSF